MTPEVLTDADSLNASGLAYKTNATWTGSPYSGTNGRNQGALVHLQWSSSYAVQNFYEILNPVHFQRIKLNGTWQPWQEILHTGNTGTAVTADVTTSATDTTADRLLKVGDFGLGGAGSPDLASNDFNSTAVSGVYRNSTSTDALNYPSIMGNIRTPFTLFHVQRSAAYGWQLAGKTSGSSADTLSTLRLGFRSKVNDDYSDWAEIHHTGNLDNLSGNWTPTAIDGWASGTGESSVWRKIGDLVFLSGRITSLVPTGGGAFCQVGNLPFPITSTGGTGFSQTMIGTVWTDQWTGKESSYPFRANANGFWIRSSNGGTALAGNSGSGVTAFNFTVIYRSS